MQAILQSYTRHSLKTRLSLTIGAAIVLNAVYCLTYRYASGNPATLFEAFSWGVINIAPWIAAIELGRSLESRWRIAALLIAAIMLSLALEVSVYFKAPSAFDLVRRIPGAVTSIAILAGISLFCKRISSKTNESDLGTHDLNCVWARSAGNYVELRASNGSTRLIRGTLSRVAEAAGSKLIRVHRQYAVSPEAIHRIERSNVLLTDGTRLPIGDRFRNRLSRQIQFVPSSQTV